MKQDSDSSVISSAPAPLVELFREWSGSMPAAAVRLLGAGSDREYWRISSGDVSAIGVVADNTDEARAFIRLSNVFAGNDIPVPKVYGFSSDCSCYLVSDLGSVDLFSLLHSPESKDLLVRCMASLAAMQTIPAGEWEKAVAFPPMSGRLIGWDLNYFKYEYLKPSGIVFSEDALENDFVALADALLSIPVERTGFMMRDCQSRNVMVCGNKPFWIDFQGGRRGPALYDAVSFLYQAKAGFLEPLRRELLDVYAWEFCRRKGISKDSFLSDLPLLRLFRNLQVLGAYGFRGLVQKRAHFIESIPMALSNLRQLIAEGVVDAYPELRKVCGELVADPRFSPRSNGRLTVSVFSFSYKKGYPEDFSGNGGGFMFDCRALHNPGRYERYKSITGLDLPVVEFLEERGEVGPFLKAASALVIPAVERYVKRGFSSLQIGFGCTGGQHRSVYCAHHLALEIAERFPSVEVVEIHREQGRKFVYGKQDNVASLTDDMLGKTSLGKGGVES